MANCVQDTVKAEIHGANEADKAQGKYVVFNANGYSVRFDGYTRLYETGKPFHFVMETADTHAPDGWLSPNAEKKFDTQYANCIYYSQKEAVKFVRWIQEQDFYENTTIVLIGDHLSMANAFFEDVQGYRRTIYNLFLNLPENLQEEVLHPYNIHHVFDIY